MNHELTFTKSVSLAASANAADEPIIPTQIPHNKLQNPEIKCQGHNLASRPKYFNNKI